LAVFVFGLDNAGKTTLISQLRKGVFISTIPTLIADVVKINFGNEVSFRVYDMPGQEKYRETWIDYLTPDIKVLIFVIDSADSNRFEEAKEELFRILKVIFDNSSLLNENENEKRPLLICGNKSDLKESQKRETLKKSLDLDKITQRQVKLLKTSALTRSGVLEVFDYIGSLLIRK
jgi:small GTP-binding protein